MSTNYYVVKKVNKDEVLNEIKNVLSTVDSYSIRDILKQYVNSRFNEDDEIHIGLLGNNKNFVFDHNNGEYYEKTRKSIDKFIRENELFNEYGVKISPDEFWELVDTCQQYVSEINDNFYDGFEFCRDSDFY